jgi:hypothetical protein
MPTRLASLSALMLGGRAPTCCMLLAIGIGASGAADAATPGSSCEMSAIVPSVARRGTQVLLEVRPSAASSCVNQADAPSQVYLDTAVVPKDVLAVFLPGTGGAPAQFPSFLQRGAARGYHVVGLSYVNARSVNQTCRAAPGDADCAGSVREEVFSGRDTSTLIAVTPADSIEGRLTSLLRYLESHRPADGWGQFLDAQGAVIWAKLSIHGNSQGAGHAGYIGKVRAVARVGLYAGPSDWVFRGNKAVNWYRLPSRTAASAYFGFVHVPDNIANASGDMAQVTNVWGDPAAFNMLGAVTDIASTTAPFAGSQRLVTTACAGRGTTREHNCPMFRGNERVWDVVSFP